MLAIALHRSEHAEHFLHNLEIAWAGLDYAHRTSKMLRTLKNEELRNLDTEDICKTQKRGLAAGNPKCVLAFIDFSPMKQNRPQSICDVSDGCLLLDFRERRVRVILVLRGKSQQTFELRKLRI